jgi:hypothetical protein
MFRPFTVIYTYIQPVTNRNFALVSQNVHRHVLEIILIIEVSDTERELYVKYRHSYPVHVDPKWRLFNCIMPKDTVEYAT